MPTPEVPPGARLLTADEAIERLVTGHHAESHRGDLQMVAAMIDLIRAGEVEAALLPDGKMAFRKVGR